MKQKKIIFLFIVTMSSFFFIPSVSEGAMSNQSGNFSVGMELSYPPFETIDSDGKPYGVSVALAEALAAYLKRPLKIENLPFVGLIPSLQTDKIDCIISSLTVTDERKKTIDFSEPYLRTGLCLLISKNSRVTDIYDADQSGSIIVVKQGTTGETFARTQIKKGKVRVLDKESSCVLEVVQGKADAFIYDLFSVYTNWQKNLTTTRANLDPFKIEYWAIGVKKNNPETLNAINKFLKEYKASGGFEKLGDKYLKTQKEAFERLGVPFFF